MGRQREAPWIPAGACARAGGYGNDRKGPDSSTLQAGQTESIRNPWIPAFAGMTYGGRVHDFAGITKRIPAETAAGRGIVRARRQGSEGREETPQVAPKHAKGDAEGGSRSRRGNRRVPRPTKQDKAWHLALAAGSRRLVEPRRRLQGFGASKKKSKFELTLPR